MSTKICIGCNNELEYNSENFYKKGGKYKNNGYQSRCKQCFNEKAIEYKNKNLNKVNSYLKEYYIENKNKINQQNKKNYLSNKKQRSIKNKEKYQKDPNYFLSRSKNYQNKIKSDPEKIEKQREYYRKYRKKQYSLKPHIYALRNQIKNIKNILNTKKNNSLYKELEYTSEQFKNHIETFFKENMTWDNIGLGKDKWNIDHKIPISWFKLNTPFNIVNNLDNLEPIWWKDNIIKSNKYSSSISKEYYNIVKNYINEDKLNQIIY